MKKEDKIKKIYEVIANKKRTVVIWDVLDYILRVPDGSWVRWQNIVDDVMESLIPSNSSTYWFYKREPIENQSEECINYVYNLIK